MDQTGEITPPVAPGEKLAPTESLPELKPELLPESFPERGVEQAATAINRAPQASVAAPLVLPPVASLPQASAATTTNSIGAIPQTADDVDVIEKEWVDKARKIVAQTRDDPHKQEQAVEELQRAYLKTRYNKDLKSSKR